MYVSDGGIRLLQLPASQFDDRTRRQLIAALARGLASGQPLWWSSSETADSFLATDQAFYVLQAQALLKLAQPTVTTRQPLESQVEELGKNKLRSTLRSLATIVRLLRMACNWKPEAKPMHRWLASSSEDCLPRLF